MKAARLYAAGDLRLDTLGEESPDPDEELVRVHAVGLCGSDLHWFGEGSIGDATLASPLVLGHEMAGTILSGPRQGQLVAIDPAVPCWQCPLCREGHPNLCTQIRFAGHGATDGGLRETMAWPRQRLHPVPSSFDADTAALLEPLGVAIHAVDLAHIKLGSVVAIVGCGPIGQLAIQAARAAGAAVVLAVEPLAHRRALAEHHHAVASAPEHIEDLIARHTADSLGADAVLEISGTEAAVDIAVRIARPGSRVVLAGIPDVDRTHFIASSARRKGLTIVLSRRMKEVYPRAIRLVETGQVHLDRIVSNHFPLADVERAFKQAASRDGHKVIVNPSTL
jgi:L-iditol 2-dehydrogenase